MKRCLNGSLAEKNGSTELPDCESESPFELLRYLYTDEVNLSESNVMGVLCCTGEWVYGAPLVYKCTEYLSRISNSSDAFLVLPFAQLFGERHLIAECLNVIDLLTVDALKSDGFAKMERFLLEELVERDTLQIEEIDLFKAVIEWATKRS